MEAIDEATRKQNILDSIKASNPKLDLSGVELIYEQHQKAYETHLKYIEELNKQLKLTNTTYN
jgi:hypothetical protein